MAEARERSANAKKKTEAEDFLDRYLESTYFARCI